MSDDVLNPPTRRDGGQPYDGPAGRMYPTMSQKPQPAQRPPTAADKAGKAALDRAYPSMAKNGPQHGDRNTGELNQLKASENPYREATEQDKRLLKRYPSLATPEHYDAKIVGKNSDGSDRVMIRGKRG